MSASIDVGGFGVSSAEELLAGALGSGGPRQFISSWVIIAVAAYLSAAVGTIVSITVGVLATLVVLLVGLPWLALDIAGVV